MQIALVTCIAQSLKNCIQMFVRLVVSAVSD